ncbi:ferric reductase [uncultured Tateyamaria sp.]|uniref:ferric reductase n=1 Tax=uncultured Tateyamaria sp. TaxID=455651 RepID=UPI00260F935D|nr:ferric reductase [uncultured Tateyamaria sp.]
MARSPRALLVWGLLGLAVLVPVLDAANSPQLAWRQPVYIAAGFAGIVGMALLLVQPLLVSGVVQGQLGRRVHRVLGGVICIAVLVHIGALWVTSPPDVVDALLLRSPTPFSVWGVIGTLAVLAAAALVVIRRVFRLSWRVWAGLHTSVVAVAVVASVVHALLIEGTMGLVSKWALCGAALVAMLWVCGRTWRRVWRMRKGLP